MQIVEHECKRDGSRWDQNASLGTSMDVRYDLDWVEMLIKGLGRGYDANFGN